jgi:hypothetical protein
LEPAVRIALAVVISRKPEEVFPWIGDPHRAMRWQKGVRGGQILTETPERIGTTFREEMQENGKTLVIWGEITQYFENRLISFRLDSKIHRVGATYSVSGNERESTLAVESIIHWKFPMNILSLLMGRKIRDGILRQTKYELGELKRLCETEQI